MNLNRIYSNHESGFLDRHRFQQLEQEQQQEQQQQQQVVGNYEDSNDNNDEMDEYDQEMARQYLSKYGDIRRHTIGTNPHQYNGSNNSNNNNNIESIITASQQQSIFATNHLNNLFSTGYESPLSQIKEINNNLESSIIKFNQNILIGINNNGLLQTHNTEEFQPNDRYNANYYPNQLLNPPSAGIPGTVSHQ